MGQKHNDNRDLRYQSEESLVEVFQQAARLHGVNTEIADYKKTNQYYGTLSKAYRELKRRGFESKKSILKLLGSEDISVRVWTAMYALEFCPEKAEPVLNDIACNAIGHQATNARMVLQEWRAGRLKFD